MEKNVDIFLYGKKYSVPESLTIMGAMEYAGYRLVRGCGCRNGFCGACATIYRIKGKQELHACLACQTQVQEGMYIATLPFFPLVKQVYDINKIKPEQRRGLGRRLFAVASLGVIFCVFLVAALVFAFEGKIIAILGIADKSGIFTEILSFLFIILFIYAIIILLNKIICPVKISFSKLVTGAFVALCIIVIGSIAFMLYLRFFNNYNKFYGSLAAIIVFLLWAYIVMLGLSIGAVTCTYLCDKRVKD